jgi:predicted nucleotidyltransferase
MYDIMETRPETFEFLLKFGKSSYRRKPVSSLFKTFWAPAFAGVTTAVDFQRSRPGLFREKFALVPDLRYNHSRGCGSASVCKADLREKLPASIGKSTMNKTEKIVLDRFKALLSERVGLHSLVMFGSRARGDADLDSDLDVLVVLDSQPTDRGRDLISDCAWEAGFEYGSSSFLSSLPNESGKRVRNVIRSSAKPCRLKEFRYEAHVRHV